MLPSSADLILVTKNLTVSKMLWIEGVAWSAQRIPTAVNLGFQDQSRSAIVLTWLSGPDSRPTTQKIW
jgi:hypothetical protein